MKTLLLSIKLFKNHPFLNVILIFELAVILIIGTVSLNAASLSSSSINILKNSKVRILHYNPNIQNVLQNTNLSLEERDKKLSESEKSLDQSLKNFSIYKGYEKFNYIKLFFNTSKVNKSTGYKDSLRIMTVDDITATSINYPLKSGNPLTLKKVDGCVPIIIGGKSSYRYKVGQKIDGALISDESEGKKENYSFIVSGILAKPEKLLNNTAFSSNDSASSVFDSVANAELVGIAPSSLIKNKGKEITPYYYYIYLDRHSTELQINEVRNFLVKANTETDTEMIENEKKQISEDISVVMPFLILLILISLCGIVSMCMLTTIKNIKTFGIYYITGCSRRRAVSICGINSLFYFIFGEVIFFIGITIFQKIFYYSFESMYFIVLPKTILAINSAVFLICLFSFVIPFFILKNLTTADILKSN